MIRVLFLLIWLLCAKKNSAQYITRYTIGTFASTSRGNVYTVCNSPLSTSIEQSQNLVNGISIQSKPFVHLSRFSIENSNDPSVNVYPNPTSDIVFVKSDINFSLVRIIDMSGRTCIESKSSIIPLAFLTNGLYTIEIQLESAQLVSQKLIINK